MPPRLVPPGEIKLRSTSIGIGGDAAARYPRHRRPRRNAELALVGDDGNWLRIGQVSG